MKKLILILFVLSITLLACSNNNNTPSLEGEWTLISYGDANNPTEAVPNVETSINFGADGQFGGNVGCNSFGADYKIEGNQITFGAAFSTLMFCEGIAEQETTIFNLTSEKTLNFELNGNQLTLTSQDGSSVIVLGRK